MDGLLQRVKESIQEAVIEGDTKAEEPGDVGVVEEVAKLRELVKNVQSKLGQQRQDVLEWLETVGQRFVHGIDADDGVMDKLDFIVDMLMAVRSEGFDTPRKACVLPPWKFTEAHGLSEEEQKPEVWIKRFNEWREDDFKEGKGFLKKKKRLFLVCAQTHRLVPCGPNGQGYDIQQPRTWLRMSVSVATFALQVACSTLAAIAAAPVSGAGAAAEAAVSAGMEKLGSTLEAQLAELTLDGDGEHVDARAQVLWSNSVLTLILDIPVISQRYLRIYVLLYTSFLRRSGWSIKHLPVYHAYVGFESGYLTHNPVPRPLPRAIPPERRNSWNNALTLLCGSLFTVWRTLLA